MDIIRNLVLIFLLTGLDVYAQPMRSLNEAERDTERTLRYIPDGEDFVIVNGKKKFNRALYGTHTAFRVETGDVPEFALYLPRMGGNLSFGLSKGNKHISLNDASYIESRYRPGARIYTIKDPILGEGEIYLTALAMGDADGMILRFETKDVPEDVTLTWRFGGVSDKRFSREGDLGVDPVDCFDLKPEYCVENYYELSENSFQVNFGKNGARELVGTFPQTANLSIYEKLPALDGKMSIAGSETHYMSIHNPETKELLSYDKLSVCFDEAEKSRSELVSQVKINTPDPYFNTLGGALMAAADGIWSGEVWLHGAVGWRMPLSGWRAAYVGDVVGWHDRARTHFDAYAASQVTNVEPVIPHPAQDKELNLARAEKSWGTQMYSNGYICRNPRENDKMHHYDMNLCYIDELLWHFNWTGDLEYARQMWPVLQRHLAWEKRNFDPDNDGLYDAYCCIWASDAVQYNSGAVTHSTAYNYRANKMAAEIAVLIGEDPTPYSQEAAKILAALNERLWISSKGYWAEYQDFMGYKKVHESTAVWSIYHALDSDINDPFQAYQATRYIDTEIPHIPVKATGLIDEGYATIATTNWLPYAWSINNVAFAEVMHTSLAYWQAGRNEEAFKLLKSSVLDGMYLGSSPENFGQISFYDAARGECYRDFGDPVGVASRALIQGLFGILPDAMHGEVTVKPGYPAEWEYASLSTPDIIFDFKRENHRDIYHVNLNFERPLSLTLLLRAKTDKILSLKVNGEETSWEQENIISGYPAIKVKTPVASVYKVEIEWGGNAFNYPDYSQQVALGDEWQLSGKNVVDVYDPQQLLQEVEKTSDSVRGIVKGELGHRTLFVQLHQGDMKWWYPINLEVVQPIVATLDSPESGKMVVSLANNTKKNINGILKLNVGNNDWQQFVELETKSSHLIEIPLEITHFGSNRLTLETESGFIYQTILTDWNLPLPSSANYELVNIDEVLNASVTQIFTNQYLSPRSPYTTLQVPVQGIGEWCHPKTTAEIDDSGLRKQSKDNVFQTKLNIPFRMKEEGNNIAFTTLWDNYPEQVEVTLNGTAKHAYLLMAGSTNHMQCHFTNGTVVVNYSDGSKEVVELVNPENWCPIEQDFYVDGKAFRLNAPRPYRLHLKSGLLSRNLEKDLHITGVYGRAIDGGAGILIDIPLNSKKELKSLELTTLANEVVIGLMSITLSR